jgi:glutamate-ammonia-ligase adenylyltransferase
MRAEFSRIAFQEPAKAETNLSRLERGLAASLMPPLASLLAHSPDPDGALNLLERFVGAASSEVLGDLARYPTALTYLVAIFGYSGFLAETFLAEPALTVQFARDRNFAKLKSKEDLMQDYARFATTSADHWLSSQLAHFKRRNYLRIVLKDVLRQSTLGETTLELSTLADVILTNALFYCDQELEKRYGQPQYRDAQGRFVRSGFSVISLGKLGGNELNYSSDIDLLFLYSHDGETTGGSEPDSVVSNKEYFVRLAHAVTRTITQTTPQGTVFRVDLRLRPEGDQGDLAISLKSALEYYEHRARDWELQMLIKARHSAGAERLTREFLRGVEPHIYGSPTDFAAVESVLWAREKISQRLRESHSDAVDVKRHRGGIRDIEFLTQCLQRLRGGQDAWVRSGGTLFALRKLNDKGWLSDHDYAVLTSAYEFLRTVEHRVQLEMGHQTHRLPVERAARDRLARRVGVESGLRQHPGEALTWRVQEAFAQVDEIYQRVIHPRAVPAVGEVFDLKPLPTLPGEHEPHSYDSTLRFLGAQAPELAGVLREVLLPERAKRNVTRFFAALLGSSERFALAREQPWRVRRALEVVGASEYLAELLIHHPEEVAVFDAGRSAQAEAGAPGQMDIGLDSGEELQPLPWATLPSLEMREKMTLLRRHFRARVLELGATDAAGLGNIFAALHRWSALAGRSVSTALCIAAQAAESKLAETPAQAAQLPFVVLGLGRLGLNEFDLASDADLVFVAASGTARDELARWTRLAEKTIEVLSSYTRDGTLFAVDTRLRPRGHEGELVVTEDALLEYLRESAQVWEAFTYLKACPVGGNLRLGQQTVARLSAAVLERFSAHPQLEAELQEMRRRLEREVMVPPSNTKTAPGGYYDVDFAVSCLRLRHRLALPPGANIERQIAALRRAALLTDRDAQALTQGAAFLRTTDHAIRLVTGRTADGLPEHVGHAEAVENLSRRWKLIGSHDRLAARLSETQQQIRHVYRRLVGAE